MEIIAIYNILLLNSRVISKVSGTQDSQFFFKADGNGRQTDPFAPPQGRNRTSDAKQKFESGRRTESYRPPQGRIRTSDGENF